MTKSRAELDDLDLVSAMWILACNDENPLVSYRGLVYRLGLPANRDIKAVVASRPELFRLGASEERVNAWKGNMLSGKSLPVWLKAIESDEERKTMIESLTSNDVFRSQFRAHKGATRSPIEIIKWGLEHLDRLRKAKAEAKDATAKKWQMWLVFCVSAVGVVSQFAIAFAKHKGWL